MNGSRLFVTVALAEAAITLVADGVTFPDACAQACADFNWNSVYNFVKRHPALREKLHAARRSHGGQQHAYTDVEYDRALSLMSEAEERFLKKWKPFALPNLDTMRCRARRDAAFAVKLNAALEKHSKRHRRRRFTPEHHIAAIAFFRERTDLRSELEVDPLLIAANLPVTEAIRARGKTNAEVKAKYAEAIAHRMAVRVAANQAQRPPKKVYGQHLLQRGLQLDDLYREVSKLFSRAHPDFDDMVSDVVVAVLDGDISFDEIGDRGVRIGGAFCQGMRRGNAISLSTPVGMGNYVLGDLLSNDDWTMEGAV